MTTTIKTSERTAKLVSQAEEILRISLSRVGNRFAYYAEETSEWYWVTVSDLRYAVTLSKDDDEQILRDIYSHWCSATGKVISKRTAKRM